MFRFLSVHFHPQNYFVSFLLKRERESMGALMMFGYLGSISAQNQELDD